MIFGAGRDSAKAIAYILNTKRIHESPGEMIDASRGDVADPLGPDPTDCQHAPQYSSIVVLRKTFKRSRKELRKPCAHFTRKTTQGPSGAAQRHERGNSSP
jgi:hypothetical protein